MIQHRQDFYAGIWEGAAKELGAHIEPLPHGFWEIREGGNTTRVKDRFVMLDDALTLQLALDKSLVHSILTESGLPVPRYVEIQYADLGPARRLIEASAGSVVVKPAAGTGGGDGLTCGVRTESDLQRASLRAAQWSRRILVEETIEGSVFRLLFLDGKLLDVVERRSPTLIGSGEATVEELIIRENYERISARGARGLQLLRVDLDCLFALKRQGWTLRTVIPEGSPVTVKSATNEYGPQDSRTIHRELSPELIGSAKRAASLVGLRLAGVDVVTPDPSAPLDKVGGKIIEVNGSPGLHHHYIVDPADEHTAVAVPILRVLVS